jgi:hypothetical protein
MTHIHIDNFNWEYDRDKVLSLEDSGIPVEKDLNPLNLKRFPVKVMTDEGEKSLIIFKYVHKTDVCMSEDLKELFNVLVTGYQNVRLCGDSDTLLAVPGYEVELSDKEILADSAMLKQVRKLIAFQWLVSYRNITFKNIIFRKTDDVLVKDIIYPSLIEEPHFVANHRSDNDAQKLPPKTVEKWFNDDEEFFYKFIREELLKSSLPDRDDESLRSQVRDIVQKWNSKNLCVANSIYLRMRYVFKY